MADYQFMENMLHNTQCMVEFTKVNGEERLMLCTLRQDYISQHVPEETKEVTEGEEVKEKKPRPDHIIPVFDMEKNAFRSIRKESITSFKYLDTYTLTWVNVEL